MCSIVTLRSISEHFGADWTSNGTLESLAVSLVSPLCLCGFFRFAICFSHVFFIGSHPQIEASPCIRVCQRVYQSQSGSFLMVLDLGRQELGKQPIMRHGETWGCVCKKSCKVRPVLNISRLQEFQISNLEELQRASSRLTAQLHPMPQFTIRELMSLNIM